jgi:hypothetical protein
MICKQLLKHSAENPYSEALNKELASSINQLGDLVYLSGHT